MAENKADKKTEAPAAPAAESTTPKTKKTNRLTLAEIDSLLAICKEKQGGLSSKYAHQLLARRKALTS
ncbi:MAG: hypothetical protein ABFD80_00970 [Acidobacteriota bacterium]